MNAKAVRGVHQGAFATDALDPASALINGYSLEVGAKDIPALPAAAPQISPGTTMPIPYLPGQDDAMPLSTARAVRKLGFEPMPHLSARRIGSLTELDSFIVRAASEAGVDRCFDAASPAGPFPDSTSLIETGILERTGIRTVGIGGHPEGHPVMNNTAR